MNIYQISPSQHYLEEVGNFIIDNFSNDFSSLKVILPSGFYCSKLQEILIKKLKISILPSIITINNLNPSDEAIFNLTIDKLSVPSSIEERIILTNIIKSYKKLQFDNVQSVNLTKMLSSFFYDITMKDIKLEQINDIANFNQSEHWQFIYNFLTHSYVKWKNAIKLAKKIDRASFYKNSLIEEYDLASKLKNKILVAGIIGVEPVTWQFLGNISSLPNGTIILPPLGVSKEINQLFEGKFLDREHPLYCFYKFLQYFKISLSQIRNLSQSDEKDQAYLSSLLTLQTIEQSDLPIEGKFSYYEYENIYYEAEGLALMCRKNIQDNPNCKIAVIVGGYNLLNIYHNFFNKFNINFANFLGEDLLKCNIFGFIYELSNFCCNEFSLGQLIILLKHSLVNDKQVSELEQIIAKKNRFVSNFEEIGELLKNNGNVELFDWISQIISNLDVKLEPNFSGILKQILGVAQKLVPDLWKNKNAKYLSDVLLEIMNLNWNLNLINLSEFPDILRQLIQGVRVNNQLKDANVTFCSAKEATLLKFDKIYLVNFNDNVWPREAQTNLWLTRQMEDELDFHVDLLREGQNFYNFYILLHNKKIIFSRSKKIESKELLVSNYFLKIKYALSRYNYNITTNLYNFNDILREEYNKPQSDNPQVSAVKSSKFPSQISATDINLLVKSPYDFYAKKILKLKSQISVNDKPQTFEFGIMVHKIIEIYTSSYKPDLFDNLVKKFIIIAAKVIEKSIFTTLDQSLWLIKLEAIATEFVEFDEETRAESKQVLAEVRGEMILNICGQDIKLTAIADRINVGLNDKVTIFDYKTGIIPTLKDISLGLAPQLLIEALIIKLGHFEQVKSKLPEQICYIKISSSKPYITMTKIEINDQMLADHLSGLTALLEYYLINGEYEIENDLSKFQVYDHLARIRYKN